MRLYKISWHMCLAFALLAMDCTDTVDEPQTAGSKDLYPMGTGCSWTYRDDVINKIFTVVETDRDTLIGNRRYKVNTNTIGENFYKLKTGNGDCYRFDILARTALGTSVAEQLVLKTNARTGDMWEAKFATVSAFLANDSAFVRVSSRVVATNIGRTVNGTRYEGVMNTFSDLFLSYKSSPTVERKVGTVDFYFAPGVGLVYYEVKFLPPVAPGLPNRMVSLLSHQIR